MSPAPDSTLDDPQQIIADLKRRLAESNAERDEALQRETATSEVLQVINSSPGDLAPVFDAMLEKAMRLCRAEFGEFFVPEAEQMRAVAIRGVPADLAKFRYHNPSPPVPGSITARVLGGEPVIHVTDVKDDDLYRRGDPQRRALVDLGGARTFLAVTLIKDRAVLGSINIYRQDVRPFSEKQIALLQNFAAQAVIAMENARLITETREALEQQTATAEVLGVINSSPGDLAPVFDAMLEKAMRLCEAAFGSLWTYKGDSFQPVAHHGLPAAYATYLATEVPAAGTGTGRARLLAGEPFVHIADLANEEPYRAGEPHRLALVDLGKARTALLVPLRKDEAVIGFIMIYRVEVRPFADKQIALLQNFAAQAVIAIENARLINETREALEQQTATSEVLQVINSSPGDLAPIFDTMLDKALRLCEAAFGILVTFDGDSFRTVAIRNVPDALAEYMNQPLVPDPQTTLGRVVRERRTVHTDDNAEAEPYRNRAPLAVAAVELGHSRTVLHVPLIRDEIVLGVVIIFRQEVRSFTDKQILLLENFAAQAVIAMENARLITETREALEQQTATAEVLGVINSSPGELGLVFDAMLDKAMRLCEGAFGGLWTFDGDRYVATALRGVPTAYAEFLAETTVIPGPGSAPYRFLHGERSVIQNIDLAVEELYRAGDPQRRALVDLGGARTAMQVPLFRDDAVLGVITIYRQEVRPFTDKQIALLQNFAAQAVIAMENARLITETREALEQQTATAEVLGVINSSPGDLAPVFDAILEKAHALCDTAFGGLAIFDGEQFRFVAAHGVPEFVEYTFRPEPDGNAPLDQLARGERLVHVADARAVGAYRERPYFKSHIDTYAVRTLLVVPLRKDGRLLGAITAFRREVRPFTEKQIALLENFAAQAVIAMENARLITETREALEQQTATAEVLQVINSSPDDLTPVFDAILEKAHRLCGVAYGSLQVYDGERFRAVAVRGLPEELSERLRQGYFGSETPPSQPLVEGESVVHIVDLAAIDHPVARWAVELTGMRTLLSIALRKDKLLIGLIIAGRKEVRPFLEKEIALLQNFAAQAVIAMENARLLGELRQRTDEVGELNRGLEARVAAQVDELGRVGRLKRFLAPQLAELIVSQGDEKILESHRREIVVVFCDLRGYTAFTETAEPEEVLEFLRQYHGALGPLVSQFEGTLDQFSGDGIMVFFNDPVPCPDPAERAVKMATAMREEAGKLIATWRRDGCELGFGAGIAQGYATLGQIGFSERSGYTAIGTVCNLAARLCAEAKDGQILISSRVARAVEAIARLQDLGNLDLKGLRRPVAAFNVAQSTSPAEARPNLTVVARDPGA